MGIEISRESINKLIEEIDKWEVSSENVPNNLEKLKEYLSPKEEERGRDFLSRDPQEIRLHLIVIQNDFYNNFCSNNIIFSNQPASWGHMESFLSLPGWNNIGKEAYQQWTSKNLSKSNSELTNFVGDDDQDEAPISESAASLTNFVGDVDQDEAPIPESAAFKWGVAIDDYSIKTAKGAAVVGAVPAVGAVIYGLFQGFNEFTSDSFKLGAGIYEGVVGGVILASLLIYCINKKFGEDRLTKPSNVNDSEPLIINQSPS